MLEVREALDEEVVECPDSLANMTDILANNNA
jgi:hypothetical protein